MLQVALSKPLEEEFQQTRPSKNAVVFLSFNCVLSSWFARASKAHLVLRNTLFLRQAVQNGPKLAVQARVNTICVA